MFFFDERYHHFEMFGLTHLLAVLFFIILIVLILVFKKRLNPDHDLYLRRGIAIFMVLMEWTFYGWSIALGGFDTSLLPLGLCAISMYTTAIALWTKSEKVFQFIFPWAITGALISLVVANLHYDLPHFRYFHYFGNHGFFLVSNLYLFFIHRFKFTYKHLLKSGLSLLAYAIVIYPINFLIDDNHLFLRAVPAEAAPLYSFLGDFWVLGFVFSIFLLFHLIYLPIHFYNKHQRA